MENYHKKNYKEMSFLFYAMIYAYFKDNTMSASS